MIFNYCPNCKANMEDKRIETKTVQSCVFCGLINWDNPTFGACAVIFNNERVLLVRTAARENWTLPGGYAEQGESLEDTVTRELNEELGIENCNIKRYLCSGGIEPSHITVFFEVTIDWLQPIFTGSDVVEAKWFNLTSLPKLEFDSHKHIIEAASR